MCESPSLILASGSAARAALLHGAGLAHQKIPAQIDERQLEMDRDLALRPAPDVALELARAKALAVSVNYPDALVIGADQTLDCEGRRFDKPADRAAARDQLAFLSGRTHRLNSAVALARNGEILWDYVGEARLSMRSLSPERLDRYLDLGGSSVLSSVGVYQLEGLGVRLFHAIEGDYFTVLGLPLLPLLERLEKEGFGL